MMCVCVCVSACVRVCACDILHVHPVSLVRKCCFVFFVLHCIQHVRNRLSIAHTDMIAATSVLQQQAGDIRQTTVNWQSYKQ